MSPAKASSSISLQLRIAHEDRPEGVQMHADRTWKSPFGGWLKVQSGKWRQDAGSGGVVLSTDAGERLGQLLGLIFASANDGDTGRFNYEGDGDGGSWTVTSTI